jgi:hypothetical protein
LTTSEHFCELIARDADVADAELSLLLRLCLFDCVRTVAANKAKRGIIKIDAFAAALPVIDIVDEIGARRVARDAQDEATVGTGDCFDRHWRTELTKRGNVLEMGASAIPALGEDAGKSWVADCFSLQTNFASD